MTAPTLRTDRLLLRPARDEDIDRILEFRVKPEVNRWLLNTQVDPEAYRSAWLGGADDPYDHSVVAELDGRPIGTVSLSQMDGMGQPGIPKRTQAGLGYIFDPAAAGHGYATEAARAMVGYAFEVVGVRRVTAECYADNLASVRVLEKIGMRREQHCVGDSWHDELGWIDGYAYAMLDHEWLTQAR